MSRPATTSKRPARLPLAKPARSKSPAKAARRADGPAAALRHLDLAAKALGWTSVERDRHRHALESAFAEGDLAWGAFTEKLLAWSRQALEHGSSAATSQRLATLAEIVALVRERPDPTDALGRALDRLQKAVAFESATFFLLDETKGTLVPVATRGEPVDLIPEVQFDLGLGLSSWVARSGRPVLLSDLKGEGREGTPRPGSFLSVPLVVQREAIGVLNAGSRRPGAFTEADRDLLVAAGAALAAPLVARRAAEIAQRHPGIDPVTQLPNGPAFAARLGEAIERGRRYGEACTIAILAPSRFGAFRAAYGVPAADAALASLGALLAARARKSDVVARLAPDDTFAILFAHQTRERARLAVDRLVSAVARHSFPQRRHVAIDAGVAAWPIDGDGVGELLAAARPVAHAAPPPVPTETTEAPGATEAA